MTIEPHGKACKICERPFTVYRWKPGPQARYKKTELCHTCAKVKNVCQVCVLDLKYGLPVEVRDSALAKYDRMKMPVNDANRDFHVEQYDKSLESNSTEVYDKIDKGADEMLQRLSRRSAPYYQRNLAHICSFFAKGACDRGDLCPYRHEMPNTDKAMAQQNIKDRFYGTNDPVAAKMMRRAKTGPDPSALPEDQSITTLWVGGVVEGIGETDLREKFEQYGHLSSISVVPDRSCAFVTFSCRSEAEEAAAKLYNNLEVRGSYMRVAWGKRKSTEDGREWGNKRQATGSAPPGMFFSLVCMVFCEVGFIVSLSRSLLGLFLHKQVCANPPLLPA